MKISWSPNQNTLSRARIAAAVVFVVLAVSWAPADEATLVGVGAERVNIVKKDTTRCKKVHDSCTPTSCEDSTYNGFGVCREGKDGPTSAITIQCCCCTDGFENRSWIGG